MANKDSNSKAKRSQVSGTVPTELRDAIEEYRWTARKTFSAVLEDILTEWAENNIGYEPPAAV